MSVNLYSVRFEAIGQHKCDGSETMFTSVQSDLLQKRVCCHQEAPNMFFSHTLREILDDYRTGNCHEEDCLQGLYKEIHVLHKSSFSFCANIASRQLLG